MEKGYDSHWCHVPFVWKGGYVTQRRISGEKDMKVNRMAKVNIISGFLGAGKTTLIKKLLDGAFEGEKVVLLENEYGEVGIDGGFMKDSGVQITELNSGCICCTLVGDFTEALGKLIDEYHPDRILIEPSGVGKLSDIRRVVDDVSRTHEIELAGCVTVADVGKCKMYARNFGEFFMDQIESAETIILSRTQMTSEDKIEKCVALLREHNAKARIITTPWDQLEPKQMLETIEHPTFLLTLDDLPEADHHDHEHHHDHDEHDHEHHHDHDAHDHEHHHDHDAHDHEHHHDHDAHDHEHHHDHDEHDHEHHHDHDEHGEGCSCGCGHDHHGHHHADEIFENIGVETPKKFDEAELRHAIEQLDAFDLYGDVLRAKGILPLTDGRWLHFDYVPEEVDVRYGSADYTGRLCVIGCNLKQDALKELFGI